MIGTVSGIGIVNPSKITQFTVSELVSSLQSKNSETIVIVNDSPCSCEIIYPKPKIGTKHIDGNYEYSYGEGFTYRWEPVDEQHGWGVRIIDKAQTNYVSPLTMICGYPVTNMSYLFAKYLETTLNLIDWDTSNVTDMGYMFSNCSAEILDLSSFNTRNVTGMRGMFCSNSAKSVNVSSFDTSKVVDMNQMFADSNETILDLSNFDTSKVDNMIRMFDSCTASHMDLGSFKISTMTNLAEMFKNCQIQTLIARDQVQEYRYKIFADLSHSTTVIVRAYI